MFLDSNVDTANMLPGGTSNMAICTMLAGSNLSTTANFERKISDFYHRFQ